MLFALPFAVHYDPFVGVLLRNTGSKEIQDSKAKCKLQTGSSVLAKVRALFWDILRLKQNGPLHLSAERSFISTPHFFS